MIGDAAKIKIKRVSKQKTDHNDAQLLLARLIENMNDENDGCVGRINQTQEKSPLRSMQAVISNPDPIESDSGTPGILALEEKQCPNEDHENDGEPHPVSLTVPEFRPGGDTSKFERKNRRSPRQSGLVVLPAGCLASSSG
jgi:hypothetical protein